MSTTTAVSPPALRRNLTLWNLLIYGLIVVQPTAPMPSFGVVSQTARGHVVTAILIAMVAMFFTALSYGRMARAYPSAGSAYTYVGRELNPFLGYVTGWSMAMDYMINPLICTIWCSKAIAVFLPGVPYTVWVVFFAGLFTCINLVGIKTNAKFNAGLAAFMGVVIVWVLWAALRYVLDMPSYPSGFFSKPFYDAEHFQSSAVFTGASIAVLTYIGFDGISTLSEEVENPRRNIMLATVGVCLITGVLAAIQVYAGQLVWPWGQAPYPDIDTAYVHVAGKAGGETLKHVLTATLLIATVGSGSGALLGAARLLYGMGRDNALPRSFFGAVDQNGVPRNNVLFVGAVALTGAFLMSYQLGAELLNFGAFVAFMGVNIAAFTRYTLREGKRGPWEALPPLLGFGTCLFIFLNLRWQAQLAGVVWMSVGIAYGFYKNRGKWVTPSDLERE